MNHTCNYKNIRKRSINGFFIGMAVCAGVLLALTPSLTLSVQASNLRSLTTQVPTSHTSATATLTVSVTNASDVVNGDTSNIQSLLANPGPDGISFREALTAANGTSGSKAIVFDPALLGTTITIAANGDLLLLASGNLTITGDIDQDGQPDITLDGHLCHAGLCSPGLSIVSSDNTIMGLRFVEFESASVEIACPDSACGTKRFVNERILNNVISSSRAWGISIETGGLAQPDDIPLLSDILFQDILVSGNTISTTGPNLYIAPAVGGAKRNQMIGVTISNNRLYSTAELAVGVNVADADSAYFGIPGPIQYSDDNLIQNLTISDNQIEAPNGFGISIYDSNYGNRNNRLLDLAIIGNTVTNCRFAAIEVGASASGGMERGTNNNVVQNVLIQNNVIDRVWRGIRLLTAHSGIMGDAGSQGNTMENVTVTGNVITNFSDDGITMTGSVSGDSLLTHNTLSQVTLHDNVLQRIMTPAAGFGIFVTGGESWPSGPAVNNTVSGLSIYNNTIEGAYNGISIYGGMGFGVQGNQVILTRLAGNDLERSILPLEIQNNIRGASGNFVEWPWHLYLPVVVN